MVHALRQIHRVLAPRGVVADLRPDRRVHRRTSHARLTPASLAGLTAAPPRGERRTLLGGLPQVYLGSELWSGPSGVLQKTAKKLADHRAADMAVQQVLRRGLFVLGAADTFEFRYYFRTLAHLDDHLQTAWVETSLPPPTRRRLLAGLRRHPSSQILVVEPVQLNVLVKADADAAGHRALPHN
jgi:hypothetical protein